MAFGTELVILPVKGAYVTVQPGETVARLADRWGVAPDDIVNYRANNLRALGEEPRTGAKLVIPHGRLDVNLAPPGSPPAASPIRGRSAGTVTQSYGPAHPGVDFGAPYGAKVYAARAGRVVLRQWSPEGYGFLVIIDHGDGSRAYYSHLKGAWANVGDWLPRGGFWWERWAAPVTQPGRTSISRSASAACPRIRWDCCRRKRETNDGRSTTEDGVDVTTPVVRRLRFTIPASI